MDLCWDDLRIVKEISACGSVAGAASVLKLNSSTVSRRLSTIEAALGSLLFDRRRTGYVVTAAGAEVAALADRIERDISEVCRRVSPEEDGLKGTLRIATTDALLRDFLTPIIAEFCTANPRLSVEVVVGNKVLNLSRGECDIAFRATMSPPDNLFGKRVATVAWAVYGSRQHHSYLAACRPDPTSNDLNQRWVSFADSLAGLKAFSFVQQRVPDENVVYRTDSVAGAASAIAAGIGIGLLPCMHGDRLTSLVRIGQIESDVTDEIWLLTHPDIRKSSRVHAFMKHCATAIEDRRDLIEGRNLSSSVESPSRASAN